MTSAQARDEIAVPSGQPVVLHEVLIDETPGEPWLRFRFLAPKIGQADNGALAEAAMADMDFLCQRISLPYLAEHGLNPARIVISLSDEAVEFGAAAPDAIQFFETYRPDPPHCIWEGL